MATAVVSPIESLDAFYPNIYTDTLLKVGLSLPFYEVKRILTLWRAAAHAHSADIALLPAEQRSPCFLISVNPASTSQHSPLGFLHLDTVN